MAKHVAESAHRSGVGDGTKYKVILNVIAVVLYSNVVGWDIEKPLCTLHDVSQVPKHILHLLFGLIGDICEKSERCHIDEIIVVKLSDITVERLSIDRCVRCAQKIFRNMQTVGKIVRRPCRNVANRSLSPTLHHAGHYLIERPISPTAHNDIIIFLVSFYFLISIMVTLGRIDDYLTSAFYKKIHNIGKLWL